MKKWTLMFLICTLTLLLIAATWNTVWEKECHGWVKKEKIGKNHWLVKCETKELIDSLKPEITEFRIETNVCDIHWHMTAFDPAPSNGLAFDGYAQAIYREPDGPHFQSEEWKGQTEHSDGSFTAWSDEPYTFEGIPAGTEIRICGRAADNNGNVGETWPECLYYTLPLDCP